MGESARRKKLGSAIENHFDHKAQAEEVARRVKVHAELDRIKRLVDEGKFEAMVVAELVGMTEDGKPKIMHSMVGEVNHIKAMCANVVMHYGEKKNPMFRG